MRQRKQARPPASENRLKTTTLLVAALSLVLSLGAVRTVPGQEAPAREAEGATTVQEPTSVTAKTAVRTQEKASRTETEAAGSPSPASRTVARRSGKGPRTLDEINIEGEIAVPQVLFITARERKHYQDFLHRQYLKGSQELCRETLIPTRLGAWLRP